MTLSETTFDEFILWCKENKHNWYNYMTIPRLKIIYDFCVKNGMECSGSRCRLKWKDGEELCYYSEPLDYKPTRADFVWTMFHEVWCKTEWAVRVLRENSGGYSYVESDFGKKIIKSLKETMK